MGKAAAQSTVPVSGKSRVAMDGFDALGFAVVFPLRCGPCRLIVALKTAFAVDVAARLFYPSGLKVQRP